MMIITQIMPKHIVFSKISIRLSEYYWTTMAQGGQKVQDVYFNISFDKTSSKSFKKPKYIIKMVVKTPLSSTDPIKDRVPRWLRAKIRS